jgi:putative membrane protein
MATFIIYIHFLSIMLLMGALISEYLLLKTNQSDKQIRMLVYSSVIHLVSLGLLLITGFLRWFVYGKGALYYSKNPVFHTKLTLYAVILVFAIIQSVKLLKWNMQRKENKLQTFNAASVKKIFAFLRIEILLVIIIPLLAVIVMRGAGG